MSLTSMIRDRGLDVAAFGKFIERWGDDTTVRGGAFDMYWGSTLIAFDLLDGVIVYAVKKWEYSSSGRHVSGIGHTVHVRAVSPDYKEKWESARHIDYRDMTKPERDRRGAWPEKFIKLTRNESGTLTVETVMDDGRTVGIGLAPED